MVVHIRNMVCNRCKMVVRESLEAMGLHPEQVELGEVVLEETALDEAQRTALAAKLEALGFALIDSRQGRLIEQIKTVVIRTVHHSEEKSPLKFSQLLAGALNHDYSYLSHLFSEVEGITIEQYLIQQKIERVKELMVYDELSLAQIAVDLGYSSTAHLSAQFKKITGLTPTQFRQLKERKRKGIDEVGSQK
jgi:AraC family transcriptional regulator